MEISKHLTFEECTHSETADKLGIKNNNPNLSVVDNMKVLANNVFEPLREHFKAPIKVNSVFRSLALNQAIHGSHTSQHCSGQAMDLDATGKITNSDLFHHLLTMDFDQLIWEFGDDKQPDWVHVSYVSKEKNRNQSLRGIKINGKTVYQPFMTKTKK
jgi:hypothetical protein